MLTKAERALDQTGEKPVETFFTLFLYYIFITLIYNLYYYYYFNL